MKNAQKMYLKKHQKFVTTLLRNPCAQIKLFFTARCAGDTKSSDIETTGIASVVFPLLILVTFRAVLHQCATEPPLGPREDPLRLVEDHQVRAIQIDKGFSQTDKGLTQAILSQI